MGNGFLRVFRAFPVIIIFPPLRNHYFIHRHKWDLRSNKLKYSTTDI